MIDTTKTLENEKSEYRVVTSYLKDIQIIEELPEDEAAALRDTANSILTLDQSRSDYLKATKKLTDTQYAQMEQEEETLTESIRTLQANEMYQAAVKRDMNYLEGEKNEWAYYREELMEEQKILRKASYVVFGMVLAFLAVILVLHVALEMDVRILFTILMVAAAASGFFMLYRNQNNTREIKRAEVNMNHAITL